MNMDNVKIFSVDKFLKNSEDGRFDENDPAYSMGAKYRSAMAYSERKFFTQLFKHIEKMYKKYERDLKSGKKPEDIVKPVMDLDPKRWNLEYMFRVASVNRFKRSRNAIVNETDLFKQTFASVFGEPAEYKYSGFVSSLSYRWLHIEKPARIEITKKATAAYDELAKAHAKEKEAELLVKKEQQAESAPAKVPPVKKTEEPARGR